MTSIDKSTLELGWCEAELGWCQTYMGFIYHYEEAFKEKHGYDPQYVTNNPPYAIFSRWYYNSILNLNKDKAHDYCFIGNLGSHPSRMWVIDFAKKHFTENSIFVNTGIKEGDHWEILGPYDYTLTAPKFSPRDQADTQGRKTQFRNISENMYYFQSMRNSKFCLCPPGDAPWSFRFYEVLMCESIPIVSSWHHTYRSPEEAQLDYKYYLISDTITYDEDMIKKNTDIFCRYHLLN